MNEPVFDQIEPVRNSQHEMAHLKPTPLRCMGVTNRRNEMRFNKWDIATSHITNQLHTLGEPHREVWLVQAWDESDEDPTPLFSFAFTDKDEAEKVRDAGVKVSSGAGMWTIDRIILDAAEDAMRVIDEMVAIDKRADEYYDKEIL